MQAQEKPHTAKINCYTISAICKNKMFFPLLPTNEYVIGVVSKIFNHADFGSEASLKTIVPI